MSTPMQSTGPWGGGASPGKPPNISEETRSSIFYYLLFAFLISCLLKYTTAVQRESVCLFSGSFPKESKVRSLSQINSLLLWSNGRVFGIQCEFSSK